MSQENVEIVQRCLHAYETDEEAWLQTLDPDFEWYPLGEGHIPSRGLGGARGVRQRWLDIWEGHAIEVDELREEGENVLAILHVSARGKESGVEVDQRFYMHFRLHGGRIVYLFEHADRASALEAAGLRE
jgi:ketosteroid isomerase-like protein